MRIHLKWFFILGACLFASCLAVPSYAQTYITVSGTIKDPNGIPYSFAKVSAQLLPTGITPTLNGQQISSFTAGQMDGTGTFSMTLANNADISPSGTTWQFTVTETGVPLPLGTGPQSFVVTENVNIGSAAVIAAMNAAAPALSNFASSGSGSITGCSTAGGVGYENGTANTLTCNADLTWTQSSTLLQVLASTTGGITINNPTAATSGADQNSPLFIIGGNYWNGSASAADYFACQDILSRSPNSAILTCTHTGGYADGFYFNGTLETGAITASGISVGVSGVNILNSGPLNFEGSTSGNIEFAANPIAGSPPQNYWWTTGPTSTTQCVGNSSLGPPVQLAWVSCASGLSGTQYAPAYFATSTTLGSAAPGTTNGLFELMENVTGSAAVAPTMTQVGIAPDASAGSQVTYADAAAGVIYNPAAALALPTPTALGNANAGFVGVNNGSASTVTPATFTISKNGATAGSTASWDAHNRCSFLTNIVTSQWNMDCSDEEGYINGTAFSGTNGHFVSFGAGNVPADSGVVAANAVTAASNGTTKQLCTVASSNKACTWIDFPDVKEIPSANCNNTTAGAGWSIGSGGTVTCRAGTNNLGGYVTITDTSSTFAQFTVTIPEDWDTATDPYIRVFFSSASDTTNGHTVIPQIKVSCPTANNGTTSDDATFSAAQSLSTTTFGASAVANGFYGGSNVQIGSTQMTGCIAGGLMIVQIGRATDTATGNINFYSATLTIPRLLTVQAN